MITSPIPSGQGYDSTQESLPIHLRPLPLDEVERHKRLTLQQSVLALIHGDLDHHRTDADKILRCSEQVTVDADGSVTSASRCRKRLCASCSHSSAREWSRVIQEAYDHLDATLANEPRVDGLPTAVGLAVTLNLGATAPLSDLKGSIKLLHRLFPRLLKAADIARSLLGSLRATEITVSADKDDIRVNTHIHALILMELPRDVTDRDRWVGDLTSAIKRTWRRMVQKNLAKLKDESTYSSSAQDVRQLKRHDRENFTRWASYITKGAVAGLARQLEKETYFRDELVKVWLEVDRAVKGVRLISSSGILKTAITDAKEALSSGDANNARRVQETPSRATHLWSYIEDRYLEVKVWDTDHARPADYMARHLHHQLSPKSPIPRHYPSLMIEAQARHEITEQESKKRAILHRMQTGKNLNNKQGHLSDL